MFSARITRASPRPRLSVARSDAPALAPRSVVQAPPLRGHELLPAANLYTETRGWFLPVPSGRAAVHAIAGFCEPPARCRPPLRSAEDPLGPTQASRGANPKASSEDVLCRLLICRVHPILFGRTPESFFRGYPLPFADLSGPPNRLREHARKPVRGKSYAVC